MGGFGARLGGFGATCHNALGLMLSSFERDFNDEIFYDKLNL
jgi:hypothetical protein